MDVTIKYFAWVRERIGLSEERVTLPPTVATIADVIAWLKGRGDGYAMAFEHDDVIRAAVDQVHATYETRIGDAKELAFFPPVTGG